MTALATAIRPVLPRRSLSVATGLAAAAALVALYLLVISAAQSVSHAFEQFAADAPVVLLIAIGFGTQVALFAELRAVDREHRAAAAITAGSTGMSGAAMLACCAHHVADVAPLIGLSAAAVFLNEYRTPLLVVGVGMNGFGIVVIARQLARAREACAMVEAGATAPA